MGDGLLLTLDGSTDVCCCALLALAAGTEGATERVISHRSEVNGRGQARILLGQVDEMLHEVGAEPVDLTKIFVGIGPGTFTGVRIAVATARGLSLALGIPVFGVSTLSCLAAWALDTSTAGDRRDVVSLVPVVDARRGQVFFAVYEAREETVAPDGRRWVMTRPTEAIEREKFGERSLELLRSGTIVVVGERDVIEPLSGEMHLLTGSVRAEYLVLGQERLAESFRTNDGPAPAGASGSVTEVGAPESVKPIYVRAPDADLHITKMRDPWVRDSTRK